MQHIEKGISIYPGLDNTRGENLALIQSASHLGIKRIFTSLQIPETNRDGFAARLHELLTLAAELDMDVISDVSPASLAILGIEDFSPAAPLSQFLPELYRAGLRTLRLDDGFTPEHIAQLSQNIYGIRLQLNASVLDEKAIHELLRHNCRLDRLEALHNFFPRENTGLSEEFTLQKTRLLQAYGIKTGAFVPSLARPRSPLRAGLPTLELHRSASFGFALRHLAAMGMDCIIIADSLPDEQELAKLAAIDNAAVTLAPDWLAEAAADWLTEAATDSPVIPALSAASSVLIAPDVTLLKELCSYTFTARPDEARDVLRTCESRRITGELLQKQHLPGIPPLNAGLPRPAGTITLDNSLYQRYQGELQITRTDLPPDPRVNVLGRLSAMEQRLLKYIKPNNKFRFI